MGKRERGSSCLLLGRSLVKHHNQQSKEKGVLYHRSSQQKKVLESVTEVSDVDAFLQQAEDAHHRFSVLNPIINLDAPLANSSSNQITPAQRKEQEVLHAATLRIPRRPPWNADMSAQDLHSNENEAFLDWRCSLARLEENKSLLLTPYEKNLDIWRQLWRVLERSDMIVMVVDARDPLFFRCPDLEAYAREIDPHKRTLLLLNKADLLPFSVREKWAEYFHEHGILFIFWSAKAATDALEGQKLNPSWDMQSCGQESADSDTKVYGRDELLSRLQSEGGDIVSMRNKDAPGHLSTRGVVVGFVGYPNVGKSSTINALVGGKRTGVSSTPGKTKHFQTLIISEKFTLCDCPGLVFPSFTSSKYQMIASGVLPIDCMKESSKALQVVANRVPRSAIEDVYRISLLSPKSYEPQSQPPLAAEFLTTYCASRGLPDEAMAARRILKDYVDGKLQHFEMPPKTCSDKGDGEKEVTRYCSCDKASDSGLSDGGGDEAPVAENEVAPRLEHVLSDLNAFDLANGLASMKKAVKDGASAALHKHHKKPRRKKDRTWRVQNQDGKGMSILSQ